MILSLVFMFGTAHAGWRDCAFILAGDLTAPVTRREVLASGRFGPHVFSRSGRHYTVYVNPGLPARGAPTLSIVRRYATRGRARRIAHQLLHLHETGWSVSEPFGLVDHEVVLGFTEGPTLPDALRDEARRDELNRALGEAFDRLEAWGHAHGMTVHRREGELRLRGHFKRRRLDFKLRPEHFLVDVVNSRLVIDDLDVG